MWNTILTNWNIKIYDYPKRCRESFLTIFNTHLWYTKQNKQTNKNTPKLQKVGVQVTSVQFSPSVMSDSLWPHRLQHTRLPCPSPTPGAYSNSCPLNWWCHPSISSSVHFFFFLQSFPASGSFPMSQFFASGSQSIWVSALTSALPMNIQDWFTLG